MIIAAGAHCSHAILQTRRWFAAEEQAGAELNQVLKSRIKTFSLNIDLVLTDYTALQNKKKLAGEWDISTDSTSIGLTDTQIKPRFPPSAQIFPQNHFFRPFLR